MGKRGGKRKGREREGRTGGVRKVERGRETKTDRQRE